MLMHVYAWSYGTVFIVMLASLTLWRSLPCYIPERVWRILNIVGVCIALILIVKYTVWGRTVTWEHWFAFAAPFTDEFFREMIMNTFLYFPLGLTLSVLIGPKAIIVGLLFSYSIESWQFIAGTGLAQGTDVICNILGTATGSCWLLGERHTKDKIDHVQL